MSLEKYTQLVEMLIATIADGVGRAYNGSKLGSSPVVLVVGGKQPRVPLLLSRVISRIDKMQRNSHAVEVTSNAHKSGGRLRLVYMPRHVLARGAGIHAFLAQSPPTANIRPATNVHRIRAREPVDDSPSPRRGPRRLQSLDADVTVP